MAGEPDTNGRFEERMRQLPDDELILALKKRKLYQPEAASFAIREAMRRGIIQTEEELTEGRFSYQESKFTLFPVPERKAVHVKLFKSLSRGLLVAAVIPGYYGVMKFTLDKFVEGIALVSAGAIWGLILWYIMEKYERKLVYPLFVIALFSMVYTVRILIRFQTLKWSDILVPAVLYGVIFYSLIYIIVLAKGLVKSNKS